MLRNLTYCIIDETDPHDNFECEGQVVKTFFAASPLFDRKRSLAWIRPKIDIVRKLLGSEQKLFNIFHFAAHGRYYPRTKKDLDYSVIYRKKGKRQTEIFRPDLVVRAELQADVFLSTCCESFNDYAIETIRGYRQVYNFIAPVDDPQIGDTTVFALMFYNQLLWQITKSQKSIKDKAIINSFTATSQAYKSYGGAGRFKLYNLDKHRVYD